ncbi:glycoside hydrolase family 15 [Candidatus Woesearchaeota archaeon]|nr:glycoside hydrolase family 15 [Candidatus Woesearchaeota archaeon]
MAARKPLTYQRVLQQHLRILKELQYDSGLFAASEKGVSTGYDKSWLRDNFYECLAFEVIGDWDTVEKTYTALLEIFLKHEWKIDHAIAHKPLYRHEYIHARFHPLTFNEFWEEWGNKQNDAIGAILFRIGELEHHHNRSILKTPDQFRIVNKLVQYLISIQYWHDQDSGMWEEDEEVHASSIGACVAGLKAVNHLKGVDVPDDSIIRGEEALRRLLPRESAKKFVDLALLSLIYPYDVVDAQQRKEILKNVEYHLLRRRGVIRYKNDYYYNKNPDGYSEEAEWTFGLAWLAIIYERLGQHAKAEVFLQRMLANVTRKGMPELYYSNTDMPNENNPLGWSESLFIVALHELNEREGKKKQRN